jgi:hypothetical protein
MRFPLILRAWHDADVARLVAERDQLAKDLAAAEAELAGVSEKYTDTAIVNNCLTEDLAKARARLAEYGGRRTVSDVLEEHDVHRKALANALGDQLLHLNWDQLIDQVVRLNKAAHAWKADYEAEKKRADRLTSHLDSGDLKAIKEWETRVKKHDAWTPGDPEKRPVDGASGRPLHPAVEFRRTQERCRQLQQLLDGRGKQAAS